MGGALFRRVIAQGMKADDVICLPMPEIKGGIVRSRLIGELAQKRKKIIGGPLEAHTDEDTVKRATEAIDLFLRAIRQTKPERWDSGCAGGICTNVGVRALLQLFRALVDYAEQKDKGFDPRNATPTEIAKDAIAVGSPIVDYLKTISDVNFLERFERRYGSGATPAWYFELKRIPVILKHSLHA
jgi:DNA sulfur modification protein DndB